MHLACADQASGYLVHRMFPKGQLGSRDLCLFLEDWFSCLGFPSTIRSDNGPQFKEVFTKWAKKLGIDHQTSSPYNPAGNGRAERAVQSIKFLMQKCVDNNEDFKAALAEHNNSFYCDGRAPPSYIFYKRRVRGRLPCLPVPFDLEKEKERRQ